MREQGLSEVGLSRAPSRQRFAALDGFRGALLVLFMCYHFGVHELVGVWTLLSMFFTISGFLIARILIRDRLESGRMNVRRFYRRRAERLLPALFATMIVVGLWATLFADDATRRQLRGDIIASTGFVMNWRLIAQADDYFGHFETASFFRHVWTLAVEEQFYVLSPLIVAVLLSLRHRKLALVALAAGMGMSAWIAARIGVDGLEAQARVYYGTDTRVGAIVAGVAIAFLLAGGWRPPAWLLHFGGPAMLGVYVVVMLTAGPMSPFMFEQGGLLLFTLATAILVLVMIDPRSTAVQRLFMWRPAVWVGVRVYGAYLYHWPVKLWLDRALPETHAVIPVLIGLTLTLILADVSFRFLEYPIMRGGVRSLVPRLSGFRAIVAGLVAAIALATFVGHVPADHQPAEVSIVPLVEGTPEYVPGESVAPIALFGDSMGGSLFEGFDQSRYADLPLRNFSVNGCGLTTWAPQLFNAGPTQEADGCPEAKATFGERLRDNNIENVVLFLGAYAMLPHWANDGSVLDPDDPRLVSAYTDTLDSLVHGAREAGVSSFAVMTIPCKAIRWQELPIPMQDYRSEHLDEVANFEDPVAFNTSLQEWADDNDVEVVDLYSAMGCADGFDGTIHGVEFYRDMLHFSSAGARMVWTWLAEEIRDTIKNRTES